jgi:DNA polymerase I-like protein with 3'-5' exonuclease and polymerase domains
VDKTPIVLDFETESIALRPHYPPKPVGFSLILPGKKPRYYGWGHPTKNNCSLADAKRVLKTTWREISDHRQVLCHHGKFDLDIAETHMGCRMPSWDETHDTMFQLFLHTPHAATLALKPSAEAILRIKPEKRDQLKEWILANVPESKKDKDEWGRFIHLAPGDLVGAYANMDTTMTLGLHEKIYPKILKAGMGAAYDRERRLQPILLENERVGIRVNVDKLRRDLKRFKKDLLLADHWLCKRLKTPELNMDADEDVAGALARAEVVTKFRLTKTGKRSVSKKNLTHDMYEDQQVFRALGYRNRIATCIRFFGEPWLAMAEAGDGHIHTTWNQVRQTSQGGHGGGTRTGRPSTKEPNFLNISKTWYDKDDGYAHPKHLAVKELPLMRSYLLPDKGGAWVHRDYSQQELRVAAHYENGKLLAAYQANPKMDVHNYISGEIQRIRGASIERRPVKIAVFRKIYGGGIPATAAGLNCSMEEAASIIKAINAAVPGIKELSEELEETARNGEPIRTWGGRLYYVEEPRFSKKYNRVVEYYYKLLNYLIQGSSADATKEAVIHYHHHPKRRGRFLVTVYDECNASAPDKLKLHEAKVLRESMEHVKFDVPMLTDCKIGQTWGSLKSIKE